MRWLPPARRRKARSFYPQIAQISQIEEPGAQICVICEICGSNSASSRQVSPAPWRLGSCRCLDAVSIPILSILYIPANSRAEIQFGMDEQDRQDKTEQQAAVREKVRNGEPA